MLAGIGTILTPAQVREVSEAHAQFGVAPGLNPHVVIAAKEVDLDVPLVVRLEGTNVQQGKDILANSGLPIIPADDLGDAARKIVAQVKEAA